MVLTSLPEDYLEVYSGLGKAQPSYLAIVPFIHKGRTMAVLECSGYRYDPHDIENMFRIFARDLMDKLITQPLISACQDGIHISSDASITEGYYVVTAISILVVILILFAYMMESGMTLTFKSLVKIHGDHPSLFLIDLLPLFISAFLHPMHRIMNRAIGDYEERVKESQAIAGTKYGICQRTFRRGKS